MSFMASLPDRTRRLVAGARVGHLATSDGEQPTVVPVCFVLLGETVYQAIDTKPKRVQPRQLRRVRNVIRNPRAALMVDQYREDWTRLWYVLLEGSARLLESGPEHRRAIRALKRKYRQYVRMLDDDALVIALDVERHRHWRSS
jgi:PPOX class probable F420-dependent enzyme